jgi:hypothetical protein
VLIHSRLRSMKRARAPSFIVAARDSLAVVSSDEGENGEPWHGDVLIIKSIRCYRDERLGKRSEGGILGLLFSPDLELEGRIVVRTHLSDDFLRAQYVALDNACISRAADIPLASASS